MLINEFVVKDSDLQSLDEQDINVLEKMIKDDFQEFEQLKEFNLSKLIEYKVKSFIVNKGKVNEFVSRKSWVNLSFMNNNNESVELNLGYRYQ
ncbi:hypothetical protein CQA53_08885 [Helicobacter didelphidarum]|uniref:Uncharacterized protein n=1 Tax=Helicobacter didelphidarum TaxID=2040648 RepID=A0A3D8IDT4_9HELI|nr:hypothetical protein [Helicobacter didelphidarum]RDU62924.1 hypothetical protein CQA53_08885 [Helicobacter didelphidarum]